MLEPSKVYGSGQKVILSVEDDDGAFALLEFGFREVELEARLYRVTDGVKALAFLRQQGVYLGVPRPDLVLLNLNLPRLTGFDVLEAVKQDPTIIDVPCVVFSSSRLDRDKARCLALGALGFISKPSSLDEFMDVVKHVCSLL